MRLASLLATPLVPVFVLTMLAPARTVAEPRLTDSAALAVTEDVAKLIETLHRRRDEVDEAVIDELGQAGSREAAEGLLDGYEKMASIYMRREILRALGLYDGVADCEEIALEHIANVATASEEPELRDAALDVLGALGQLDNTPIGDPRPSRHVAPRPKQQTPSAPPSGAQAPTLQSPDTGGVELGIFLCFGCIGVVVAGVFIVKLLAN